MSQARQQCTHIIQQPVSADAKRSFAHGVAGNHKLQLVAVGTCLRNVIGFWPTAWQSPMLALITLENGFLAPCQPINTHHVSRQQLLEHVRTVAVRSSCVYVEYKYPCSTDETFNAKAMIRVDA